MTQEPKLKDYLKAYSNSEDEIKAIFKLDHQAWQDQQMEEEKMRAQQAQYEAESEAEQKFKLTKVEQ